ncbi:hypothetical protein HanRHA438_Chr04g0163171 [Helianthus annuus]|nr:hypothetical protein HanHA300_Chr04g0125891 [Helianthus annuus]KAJ0596077.1 hypothetical protein HanHA89_Chr04g0138691 [Helianthus annuus]KAJ0756727.1 hypothetical protein HanLR1_Chr04g0130431 [Helianthus annuus]KAJ0925742.1 hypothetical protein HanRHA438_Chr04g0163171 [Helianthus annuus]
MSKAAESWIHHVWKHIFLHDPDTLQKHKTIVLCLYSKSFKAEVFLSCLHILGQSWIYQEVLGFILLLMFVLDYVWKCDRIIRWLLNLALIIFLLSGSVKCSVYETAMHI